ncbi:MAG: aminopeptidase N, partial [Acidiferrobacterales bacterium]
MKHATPKTIYLKEYTPPDYFIDAVTLTFELADHETVVHSHLKMRVSNPDSAGQCPLVLHGEELALLTLKLDGKTLPDAAFQVNEETLTINQVPKSFDLEITTKINPGANTSLEGLYVSNGKFYTQCEAEGFRKITYYLDRPDTMSLFTTKIIADKEKYPVLLSNGNLLDAGELDGGKHFATWQDPFRKPCYLFALVAGKLACLKDSYTTGSDREVALEIYVEDHDLDKTQHAMDSLKRAMAWDEQRFGLMYDLDIYMIVAVGDFNMGAMENKGLNIFNTAYTLARPETATDADYENIEGVIGHEYFHNWTGNRVTCRDWFQLSLKEGLTVFRDQEFSADMASRPVKRIQDVRMLRARQFPEDAGPMAHPVRPQSYVEINNFYTVTVYEKGAEVVRMYQTLLGQAGFRKGMDLYFKRHDGQAVTTDDFRAAMADANGVDLTQFNRWYEQAGTPQLKTSGNYDAKNKTYVLTLKQRCPDTPANKTPDNKNQQPFHMPVAIGLLDKAGRDIPLQLQGEETATGTTRVLELKESEQKFQFINVADEPVPSILRNFSAPVELESGLTDDDLAFLAAHDSDAFNRWDAGQRLATGCLLSLISDFQQNKALIIDQRLVTAIANTLSDKRLDGALVACALTLPSENELAEKMTVADPDAIFAVRKFVRSSIAEVLQDEFENKYLSSVGNEAYVFDSGHAAKRALKNTCLSYLMALDTDGKNKQFVALCYEQFSQANNMTDQMAALAFLVQRDCPERQQALDEFYKQWQHEALVVNKWLALQASAGLPGALDQVKALINHEAFSIKNPNNVRALIGSFAMRNAINFHAPDGAGYQFLADQVLALNDINPQVASRIVTAFSRWRKYDDNRQQRMGAQLERILAQPDLSKDVYEIVS